MKAQQKIDKVLEAVKERVQEEVGSLIGAKFKLSDFSKQIISKGDFFADQAGKKVIAKIDVNGEIEGLGGLVLSVKDAIRLGGTLIMLPSGELDEVSKSENYTEEIEDSYGEIANIIAGAYTKGFEDSFPKDCRFVRKEQDIIVPAKVDISSSEPFPDQYYYWIKSTMNLDDQEMGEMSVLLPAIPFGLQVPGASEQESEPEAELADENESIAVSDEEERSVAADDDIEVETDSDPEIKAKEQPEKSICLSGKALEKHKKLIDKLLQSSKTTVAEEVGALLGVGVKLGDPENRLISKADFFQEEISGKHVLADMDIVGDLEGKSFLFVSLKDAIRIGSTLIMLPPSELETAVSEEEFTEDAKDAYGEIANIMSGAYTTVFQEQYTKSIRFIKQEIKSVSPLKIECETDELIPNQLYYFSSCSIEIDGKGYGDLTLLLPAGLMGLEQLDVDEGVDAGAEKSIEDSGYNQASSALSQQQETHTLAENDANDISVDETAEILIIENNSNEADTIHDEIKRSNIAVQRISFIDSINPHLTDRLKLIILVMNEVDEQAYGIAIKLRAMRTIPIVAAGSEWTRSRVIKAVKYGVTDILLTPSNPEDIREKINNNMLKMAA